MDEEHEGLLHETQPADVPAGQTVPAADLYVSHFLSTWNARLFEFAAVLFLSAAFPDTLLPVSVYAVTRGVAAMLGAGAVGRLVDTGERLRVVRASIVGQRVAVVASCLVFALLLPYEDGPRRALFVRPRVGAASPSVVSLPFAALLAGACVEKLAATLNLVAVERDWVVVVTRGCDTARRRVNAQMRRIDLVCKLAAPLAIALLAVALGTRTAVWATLAMSACSVGAEYLCIARVYRRVPALREPRQARPDAPSVPPTSTWSSVRLYARHAVFLPSLALALLYLSVLSFSGTMVTFLLAAGYTPLAVGLARTASTVCELSATWLAPLLMARVGVVRGGIWSLSWQALWLTAATAVFVADRGLLGASGLALGVMLSRVGLWGFDLCAQNIVQDEVEDAARGAFSAAEAAFQNLFEVLAYALTIVFSEPADFAAPVFVSVAAVYVAAALYTLFVRRRRGHLFHAPPVHLWLEKWTGRR